MRAVAAILCPIWLAACASLETPGLIEAHPGLPDRAGADAVPFHAQTEDHCGPAALAMVLGWSGDDVGPAALAPVVFTPGRSGSLAHDVTAAARRHGRLAVPVTSTRALLAELAAGHPVLVLQNLGLDWVPRWHYAVATGYDLDAGQITLHSGAERDRTISLATFERTWARGGRAALVVLPSARLPASAGVDAALRAAAGLERADRPADAAVAYAAILERWPGRLPALIGLANASYAAGDLAAAERALRSAVILHPDAGAAWNNLAHVLAETGRPESALEAATRAVRIAGPHREAARLTLAETRAMAGR